MEVPANVLEAIKNVVEWRRGSDGPDEICIDEIIACDIPILDEWLVKLGVLPEAIYDENMICTNLTVPL